MEDKKRIRRSLPMPGVVIEQREPYPHRPLSCSLSCYKWEAITPKLLYQIKQDVMAFLYFVYEQGEIYFPCRPDGLGGIVMLFGNFDTICEYDIPLLLDDTVPNEIIRLGRIDKNLVDVSSCQSTVNIDLHYRPIFDFGAKGFARWRRDYGKDNKKNLLGEGWPLA